jgi:hypothetical protein
MLFTSSLEGAQEGEFQGLFKGVIILHGVKTLKEVGLEVLGIGQKPYRDGEILKGGDEGVFPSIPLGQGEEERRGVSGIESSQKGAEGRMRLFPRRPLGSADDDA